MDMDRIRVMIVDDEILAIEDIVDLIDWEEIGFEIAATVRNGRQALDAFHTIHPEVIISDIRMPVMDGLEMSQAILSVDKNVKILLLTGYEEFEYAKKAIKIGVFDYILKNEITRNILYSKIMELKEEIKKEKYEAHLILRNLLKDLIIGQNTETDNMRENTLLLWNETFYFVMLETDVSFLDAISDFQEDRRDLTLDINRFGKYAEVPPEGLTIYEMIQVEKNRIILLLKDNKNISEYEATKGITSFIRNVQHNFKKDCGNTLSAYIYLRKARIIKFHELYEHFKLLSKYKVFSGRDQLFDSLNFKINVSREAVEIDEKKLTRYIEDFDLENATLYVDQLYNETVIQVFNIEGFVLLVKEVLHVIQTLKRSLYRSYVELNNPETMLEEAMWYKAEDIKKWLVNQIANLISVLQNAGKNKYSSDVQRALEYIYKFYNKEDLTVGEVSEKIGLSVTNLSAKLKKETGLTFLEHLTNYRIEKAKKLLGSENCKVYEISGRIGYKTSQYFSKVFYKATGKTPIDYRKEYFNL
jgi:two-component system response regulator YesN